MQEQDLIAKIQWYLSLFTRALIALLGILAIYEGRLFLAFATILVLLVSFLPAMIMRRVKLFLPQEFEFSFVLFLLASLVLGDMRGYYVRFAWWDTMLHSFSAVMFGIIGFMIIYALYNTHKVVFAPSFAAVFTFTFALGLGALWEIIEFLLDSSLGLNMQRSGLVDTMTDLIVDAIGAIFVSVIGYFYLRGGSSLIMDRLVKRFVHMNKIGVSKKGH